MAQCRVIDDAGKCFRADAPLADACVAILAAAQRVHAVVEMDGFEPVQPDHLVKLREHAVQVAHDVISRIVHVARVEAHAHFVALFRAVDYLPQFLERASHLASLSRHRFQQHRDAQPGREGTVQRIGNLHDARFHALSGVAARVEVVQRAGQGGQPLQVVGHDALRESPCLFVGRTQVHGVRRMRQQRSELVAFHQRGQCIGIGRRDVLGRPSPRVAGKELECVGVDTQRILAHGLVAFRERQMTTYVQHVQRYCGVDNIDNKKSDHRVKTMAPLNVFTTE